MRCGSETLLKDGQGNTRLVTDSNQTVTASLGYSAFGTAIGTSGTTSTANRWGSGSGYRSDGDTPSGDVGYVKVGARYYDPFFGRFISRDTDLGQHPYNYCDGDPINCTDSTGHSWFSQIFSGVSNAVQSVFNFASSAVSNIIYNISKNKLQVAIFTLAVAVFTPIAVAALGASSSALLPTIGFLSGATSGYLTAKLGRGKPLVDGLIGGIAGAATYGAFTPLPEPK